MDVARPYILVIDDAADSTIELLALWGYDARACYSGMSALVSVNCRRPDVVLLDLAMPRMDGFRFAELFRGLPRCEMVPIISISGHSGAVFRFRAREVGIHHYLLKPTDPDRLRELLALGIAPEIVDELVDKRGVDGFRCNWWRQSQLSSSGWSPSTRHPGAARYHSRLLSSRSVIDRPTTGCVKPLVGFSGARVVAQLVTNLSRVIATTTIAPITII